MSALSYYFQTKSYTGGTVPVGGMRETAESGKLKRPPLRVRTRLSLQREPRERLERREVMQAARERESLRRESVRAALAGLQALLPAPELERGKYVADELERLYKGYRQERRELAALMTYLPNDGRPPMAVRVANTVNGQEVRASRRWQSSSRSHLQTCIGADGREWDFACYRLKPDGSREPLELERKSRKSQAARKSLKRERPNVASGIAGVVRMGEQD